jgi:putative ABC transport system permease protein
VVSDRLAEQLWPGADPVGQVLQWNEPGGPALTVVGVVPGIRDVSLTGEPQPMIFIPHEHLSWPQMTIMLRTGATPAAMAPAVREAIWAIDPNLPAPAIRPLASRIETATAGQRFNSRLLSLFAAVALVMAALGIYGVLSYAVERRTREIGIRLALGAPTGSMIKLVLRHAASLVGAGLAVGLIGSLIFGRLLESLLYETSAYSAAAYLAVAAILTAVALLAGYLPAARAAKIDPAMTLRQE